MSLSPGLELTQSSAIMAQSKYCFPGGVNSPVRSFSAVGGTPIVFSHGQGKHLYDVDGNSYVDFCSSWGPLILGYSHPKVVEAIKLQADRAISFGAPCELELKLADKIKQFIPQLELLRFVNSGTEATMSAIRLARAVTGRKLLLKFNGCYHGHADHFLVQAGSGLATLGIPSSAGVPIEAIQNTLSIDYNSIDELEKIFSKYGHEIAAVIIEPVAANMALIKPQENFLQIVRQITKNYGALLVFDEVITGFRLARGGCAEIFALEPDLWTFGKIIGGGLPAAAYGGKAEFMQHIAPLGSVYQAGTLSGNPLAMAAGLATLTELENSNAFSTLERLGLLLDNIVGSELTDAIQADKLCYSRQGSIFCFFFGTNKIPQNFTEVSKTDMQLFNKVYHAWLENGIYWGPSGYEVGFLSTCIAAEDLLKLVQVIKAQL